MPMLIQTWDLPFTKADMEWYQERRAEWVPTLLRQPGCIEFRAYRNPSGSSPQVMVQADFETMDDLVRWTSSDEYRRIMGELRGCGNITTQVWDNSPLVPHPVRPKTSTAGTSARPG